MRKTARYRYARYYGRAIRVAMYDASMRGHALPRHAPLMSRRLRRCRSPLRQAPPRYVICHARFRFAAAFTRYLMLER